MAKKNKSSEQNSQPDVLSDAEIAVDTQQTEQPDAPPIDTEATRTELTPEEITAPAQDNTVTLSEMGELQKGHTEGENLTTERIEEAPPTEPISFEAAKAAKEAEATTEIPIPEEQEDARQEWDKPLSEIETEKQSQQKRRGRQQKEDKETSGQSGPKSDKTAKADKPPKAEKVAHPPKEQVAKIEELPAPPEPITPPEPIDATRAGEVERIVYLNLSDLHAFKDHPFEVKEDEEMRAMVSSVKDKGVTQPAIVRPREDGGYELVSGHRRHRASEMAGMFNMPCIVRSLTDEQAITQMVEDNTNQREQILPSERAKALKMQLEAIKRQGARGPTEGIDAGKRSNEIVAERNKMTVKQVQRFIKLTDLVPDLQGMVDAKQLGFTPAVEIAFIKPKQQRYIAVAIEGQQSGPSLSQAQRMRELDQKGMLNGDVIDGIMLEEKKEADKVIISTQELGQYFGKEKTPREMKDQIMTLLDDWKAKQPELLRPEKKAEQEK